MFNNLSNKNQNNQSEAINRSQYNQQLSNSLYSRHGVDVDQNRLMKNAYKNQLDQYVNLKNKQKMEQKQKLQKQRNQYNQRLLQGMQSEKVKDASYKNYYNMLLNNQKQMQGSYVSPYSEGDNKKDHYIKYGMQENRKKLQFLQKQKKRIQSQRVNNYRMELQKQMQQKKVRDNQQRQNLIRNQQDYRRFARLPQQIKQIQRQRRLEEMNKYKEDLDKVRQQRQLMRSRVSSQHNNGNNYGSQVQRHNPLLNPLTYNIQNPYILKEISRQSGGSQGGNRNFGGNNY